MAVSGVSVPRLLLGRDPREDEAPSLPFPPSGSYGEGSQSSPAAALGLGPLAIRARGREGERGASSSLGSSPGGTLREPDPLPSGGSMGHPVESRRALRRAPASPAWPASPPASAAAVHQA